MEPDREVGRISAPELRTQSRTMQRSKAPRILGMHWLICSLLVFGAMGLVLILISVFALAANQFAVSVLAPSGPLVQPSSLLAQPFGRVAHTPPPATDFPNLLAYWSFDEGAGDAAADASGNVQAAKLLNAAWAPGVRGQALRCNGPGSYVDYGWSSATTFAAGEPFTMAL
ncbi:MAG TPA: hypothetical protein VMS17_30460, partial [Gemmataceae bacterium]|nr:hypothetical protein [Gemmataceae bacterium]